MMGPTRDCRSVTKRLVFSDVRFSGKNSNVNIPTGTTSAAAATKLNTSSHTCILAPYASPGGATPSYRLVDPLRLRLAQICFASGFHCRRDGILLADRNFLAALDQLIPAFPQFPCFLLTVLL